MLPTYLVPMSEWPSPHHDPSHAIIFVLETVSAGPTRTPAGPGPCSSHGMCILFVINGLFLLVCIYPCWLFISSSKSMDGMILLLLSTMQAYLPTIETTSTVCPCTYRVFCLPLLVFNDKTLPHKNCNTVLFRWQFPNPDLPVKPKVSGVRTSFTFTESSKSLGGLAWYHQILVTSAL